MAEPTLLNS